MKNSKIFRLTTFILCLLICATCMSFIGCKNDNTVEEQKEERPEVINLADFETYQDGFQMMRPLLGFGKVSANTDKAFVKTGERSAKLQPQGLFGSSRRPTIFLPFMSPSLNYNYSDLREAKSISFDMFNSQDVDKNVEYGFVSDHESNKGISPCFSTKSILKPGWNHFEVEIGHDFLSKIIDIDNVYGFFWRYDLQYHETLAECDVFYLDNVKFKTCEKVEVAEPAPTLVIADFEHSYESYLLTSELDVEMEVVRAENGVVPTSGFRMMHVKNDQPILDSNGWPAWSYLVLNGRMVKNAMKNVKDFSKAYIEFDVYDNSVNKYVNGVSPDWFLDSGEKITAMMFGCSTKNKEWVRCSMPVSEILKQDSQFETKAGKANLWLKYVEFDLYFDNFRIVEK